MPTDLTDLDNQQDDDQENPPQDSTVIRELRQKAKNADAQAKENAQLKQKIVLLESGLTGLSEKQLKALTAAHDGDWTAETLKATATELGFNAPATPPPADIPPPDTSAMQRMDDATGQPPPPPADFDAKIAQAKSPDEVLALLRGADLLYE